MKTQIYFRITMALFFLVYTRSSFAQDRDIIIKADTLKTVVITNTSPVSQKVSNVFKKNFKKAVNPRWYKINTRYFVKFISEDQKNTALYNDKGRLIYHLSYGTETNLPYTVREQIKSQYPKSNIITAIHINQDQRSIWVVNLEEGNDYILTRVEDDELDEVERFKDANAI